MTGSIHCYYPVLELDERRFREVFGLFSSLNEGITKTVPSTSLSDSDTIEAIAFDTPEPDRSSLDLVSGITKCSRLMQCSAGSTAYLNYLEPVRGLRALGGLQQE